MPEPESKHGFPNPWHNIFSTNFHYRRYRMRKPVSKMYTIIYLNEDCELVLKLHL